MNPFIAAMKQRFGGRQESYGRGTGKRGTERRKRSSGERDFEPVFDAVVAELPGSKGRMKVTYRLAGDGYLLVEAGEAFLDLRQRVYIHLLEQAVLGEKIPGIREMTPGVRALLISYDNEQIHVQELVKKLKALDEGISLENGTSIPSRRVELPIVFQDSQTTEAVEKYMATIRKEAPYLPDNMEFIARCNGLSGAEEVKRLILATEYLVMGLGDVYMGAPCAVPLDPRCHLVVPKYNPARTYTPEGAVGIGGVFMAIYSMDSPGGYQLVGRTLPVWNTLQTNKAYKEVPWLLRPFDRIQYKAVTEPEFTKIRQDLLEDKYTVKIEKGTFDIHEYLSFCESCREETELFKKRQREAAGYGAERN